MEDKTCEAIKNTPQFLYTIYNLQLTSEQIQLQNSIYELQNICSNATLTSTEMVQLLDMTKKQKKKLVSEIYFKDKKRKEFYTCKDGRVKSYNPQFIAKNEDDLIDKLYCYYFDNTLESVYKSWVRYRADTKIVSGKTIEEDISIWRRFISDTPIATMKIIDIKPKHIIELFHKWTGNGLITKKDFNNRKSVLNGIFRYAVLKEILISNPITSISCNELKYKYAEIHKKAYTKEERLKLLNYLDTLPPDAYILAIKLAFYGIFRIGEIKALTWDISDGNKVTIRNQLVEERILQDDFTLTAPQLVVKDPKGNPHYSIRTEYISQKGVEILTEMKNLNPDGEFLFMFQGRTLTTDSFNKRLKKYSTIVGIPYLSSHKIRFTGASMLYDAGVKAIDIQPLLGHSTLAMTQHYIGQKVDERDLSQMSTVLG